MKASVTVLVVLALGALYAFTMSRTSSYDALCYYGPVEAGEWKDLGHPHHLIYLPALRLWYSLWRGFGYQGGAVLPSKVLSLIAALLAIPVFARVLTCFLRPREAVPFLLILGLTYVVWHFASEAEPVTFFVLFSLLNLLLLLKIQTSSVTSYREVILIAAVNSLGVMFHQELFVFVPISAIYLGVDSGELPRAPAVAIYAGSGALLIGAPYILAAHYFGGATNLAEALQWATLYGHHFREHGLGTWSGARPSAILQGIARTYLGGSALKPYLLAGEQKDALFYLAASPFLVTAALTATGLILCAVKARSICRDRGRALLTVLIVLVTFGCLASWWQPINRTFWAPAIPCLIILTGLGYLVLSNEGASGHLRRIPLLVLTVVLLVGNLAGGIIHKRIQDDPTCPVVTSVREHASAGSLVILRDNRTWRLLDYYCPSLQMMLVTCPRGAATEDLKPAVDPTIHEVARALSRAEQVFITSDLLTDPESFASKFSEALQHDITIEPCFTCSDPTRDYGTFTLYEISRFADSAGHFSNPF